MKKLYPEESVQSIANAIRDKKNLQTDKVGRLKAAEMASAINTIRLGCPIAVSVHMKDGRWCRPEGWTDLDALSYGQNELYMTYDCSERVDDPHVSFSISGASYIVTIGSQVWSMADGATFSYAFMADDGTYPLVHVKADGDVTDFCFTSYRTDEGRQYAAKHQPMVERVGEMADWSSTAWGTSYLEREKVGRRFCADKSIYALWKDCYSLQSLDLSGWDTSKWAVTTLSYTWAYCYSLQSLDLSGWDTSKWAVSTFQAAWCDCYSLKSLDIRNLTNLTAKASSYGMVGMIGNLNSCRSINISSIDLSKISQIGSANYYGLKGQIEDFVVGESNYGKFLSPSYNYFRVHESCTHLTHASLIEIGKMLGTVTTKHYLTLGVLASRLTTAEKEEITAKGWTIV